MDVATFETINGQKVFTMKPKVGCQDVFSGKTKQYQIQTEEGEIVIIIEPILYENIQILDGVKLPPEINSDEFVQNISV